MFKERSNWLLWWQEGMKIMQKKVKMLANGEDRGESQNPIANSVNESTNKKVANHCYKFYNGIQTIATTSQLACIATTTSYLQINFNKKQEMRIQNKKCE